MSEELLKAGLPPANDRMLTTCFLAALVHGIIILGVTFSSQRNEAAEGDGPALEVVLVNDQAPAAAKNPKAAYLAQRSQIGSGNTLKRERALIPRSSLMAANRPGIPDGEGVAAQQAGSDLGDDKVIATRGPSPKILYFAAVNADDQPSKLPLLLENRPDLGQYLTPPLAVAAPYVSLVRSDDSIPGGIEGISVTVEDFKDLLLNFPKRFQ